MEHQDGKRRSFEADLRLIKYFDDRKKRAAARLTGMRRARWYFAIAGLHGLPEELEVLPGEVWIQPVNEPPGEVELATALSDKRLMSSIGRYMPVIGHELAIGVDEKTLSDQGVFNLAWEIIGALRIRSCAELLVPAVADHSWSTIAAVPANSCRAQLLEDVPRAQMPKELHEVTTAHIEWVRANLFHYISMMENPAFRLASEAFCTCHFFSDQPRLMMSTLWAGIEALFGFNAELRYRLAASIAAVLEPKGDQRLLLFRRVKKLYDVRSRAVHGAVLKEARLSQDVAEVRSLLSRLLRRFVEENHLPDEDEIDSLIFGE